MTVWAQRNKIISADKITQVPEQLNLYIDELISVNKRFEITTEDYWAVDTLKVGGKLLEGIRAQPIPWIDRGQGGPKNKSKIVFHEV
jgi:hypothetical protein